MWSNFWINLSSENSYFHSFKIEFLLENLTKSKIVRITWCSVIIVIVPLGRRYCVSTHNIIFVLILWTISNAVTNSWEINTIIVATLKFPGTNWNIVQLYWWSERFRTESKSVLESNLLATANPTANIKQRNNTKNFIFSVWIITVSSAKITQL